MDARDDFEKWTSQWEQAQKDGIFKDAPKPIVPTPQNHADDFFGNHNPDSHGSVREADAAYWNRVYRLSANMGEAPDPLADEPDHSGLTGDAEATLNEDATDWSKSSNDKMTCPCKVTKPDGKSVAAITDDLGKLANPVHTSTRGPDNKLRVTPNWSFGPQLAEIHNLKIKLQELGAKIAADPMLEDKKTKGIISQIDTLTDKIDELSDSLAPEFKTEYLS